MADRKELLEGARDTLKRIDAALLESSNVSLAARVERLIESACREMEFCGDYPACRCDCEAVSDVRYGTDVFSVIYDNEKADNVDALRYMATYDPQVRVRVHYAAHSLREVNDLPAGFSKGALFFDHTEGTVTISEAIDRGHGVSDDDDEEDDDDLYDDELDDDDVNEIIDAYGDTGP